MLTVILWYFTLTVLGYLAFPLAYRLLPALPERGFALSRALGLLVWGFAFWLLSSLGILINDQGGLLLALGVLIAASVWAWRGLEDGEIKAWLRENRRLVINVEVLFIIAFVFWVIVRAANPAIAATEKPMELAFINSIMRSTSMPPNDPWLSGYAISYYYFGFVQTAMLAKVVGATGGEAFTLALATVFSLTAVGAYGIVYNLLAALRTKLGVNSLRLAFLGPIFLPLLSNAEGLLEILHAKGFLWTKNAESVYESRFWKWLDIEELRSAPIEPLEWLPRNFETGSWWWWRASRVIQDYDFSGADKEIINEFPMFSFILGDLHPHVLVMPFALLSIGLALNLMLGGASGVTRIFRWRIEIAPTSMLLAATVFGGLAFLNIWEFPVHVGIFSAAYVLWRVNKKGWSWQRLTEFLLLGFTLGIGAIILYFPYFVSFASQAGGLIPNLVYATRGAQMWVMFATLWIPIFAYLLYRWVRSGNRKALGRGLIITVGIFGVLWALSLGLPVLIPSIGDFILPFASNMAFSTNPFISGIGLNLQNTAVNLGGLDDGLIRSLGATEMSELIREAVSRRWQYPGGWITLMVLLSLVVGLLSKQQVEPDSETDSEVTNPNLPIHSFAILLLLFGAMLVILPEFVYIRDFFGYRINTIFKFYYQAWLLWSLIAAFGTAVLISSLKGMWRSATFVGLTLVLITGLTYTVLGVWDRARGFQPENGYVLDGAIGVLSAGDAAAVAWLLEAPVGVLAESVGGSYSAHARISAHSGQMAVLGWSFHETQWRGGETEKGSRESDMRRLYSTADWLEAQAIIQQYGIRYIFVGGLENNNYQVSETKFLRNLSIVYQFGNVTIYEAP